MGTTIEVVGMKKTQFGGSGDNASRNNDDSIFFLDDCTLVKEEKRRFLYTCSFTKDKTRLNIYRQRRRMLEYLTDEKISVQEVFFFL